MKTNLQIGYVRYGLMEGKRGEGGGKREERGGRSQEPAKGQDGKQSCPPGCHPRGPRAVLGHLEAVASQAIEVVAMTDTPGLDELVKEMGMDDAVKLLDFHVLYQARGKGMAARHVPHVRQLLGDHEWPEPGLSSPSP